MSGWAHGIEAIQPMGDALADSFDVHLMTGSDVLKSRQIPDADYIVTGSNCFPQPPNSVRAKATPAVRPQKYCGA